MANPHDIDAVISAVRSSLPDVQVVQMNRTHPADDDGLWWFRLPGITRDVQIESSTYDCPFLIEHDDMKASDAITARSVSETVSTIVSYLRSISSGQQL